MWDVPALTSCRSSFTPFTPHILPQKAVLESRERDLQAENENFARREAELQRMRVELAQREAEMGAAAETHNVEIVKVTPCFKKKREESIIMNDTPATCICRVKISGPGPAAKAIMSVASFGRAPTGRRLVDGHRGYARDKILSI